MTRRDGPAIRDTGIWLAVLLATAWAAWATWGTWLTVPCFIIYGLLYGSANDARWHETGHGTAFKTRWMNDALYQLSSFATLREPELWRWSHARHHTDTIIVGRDPEIVAMRPPEMLRFLLSFLGIPHAIASVRGVVRHVFGVKGKEERTFIPEHVWPSIFRTARIWAVIHLAIFGVAIGTGSILPVLFVGALPTMYGAWLAYTLGVTQHVGLAEDVLDHRLNARTIRMNPVLRFLYWNMNYHLEHHLYPTVPYHRLPDLHDLIKDDIPPSIQARSRPGARSSGRSESSFGKIRSSMCSAICRTSGTRLRTSGPCRRALQRVQAPCPDGNRSKWRFKPSPCGTGRKSVR